MDSCMKPSYHTASKHPHAVPLSCSLGRTDFPKGGSWASPLASRLATASGRIEFVPCGLVVCLRLLSTLPRGNAVTFDYTPEHRRGEDFHLSDSNLPSIALVGTLRVPLNQTEKPRHGDRVHRGGSSTCYGDHPEASFQSPHSFCVPT